MGTEGRTSPESAPGFSHGTKATFVVAGVAVRRPHVPKSWAATHLELPRLVVSRVPPGSAGIRPHRYRIPVMRDVAPDVAPDPEGLSGLGRKAA